MFVPRDVPGRDETGCQNPVPSRGKILSLSRCTVVPLSRDKEGTSIPLSRKFALSRPVGNPSLHKALCLQKNNKLNKKDNMEIDREMSY